MVALYDVKKGQMVQEFEEWTFFMKLATTGYQTVLAPCNELEGITNTFDALKDTVANSFKINKYQTALQETLSNGEYQVEIKDAYYEFTGM